MPVKASRFMKTDLSVVLPTAEFPPANIEFEHLRKLIRLGPSNKKDLLLACAAQADDTITYVYSDTDGTLYDVLLTRKGGTVHMVAIATRQRPD